MQTEFVWHRCQTLLLNQYLRVLDCCCTCGGFSAVGAPVAGSCAVGSVVRILEKRLLGSLGIGYTSSHQFADDSCGTKRCTQVANLVVFSKQSNLGDCVIVAVLPFNSTNQLADGNERFIR